MFLFALIPMAAILDFTNFFGVKKVFVNISASFDFDS